MQKVTAPDTCTVVHQVSVALTAGLQSAECVLNALEGVRFKGMSWFV